MITVNKDSLLINTKLYNLADFDQQKKLLCNHMLQGVEHAYNQTNYYRSLYIDCLRLMHSYISGNSIRLTNINNSEYDNKIKEFIIELECLLDDQIFKEGVYKYHVHHKIFKVNSFEELYYQYIVKLPNISNLNEISTYENFMFHFITESIDNIVLNICVYVNHERNNEKPLNDIRNALTTHYTSGVTHGKAFIKPWNNILSPYTPYACTDTLIYSNTIDLTKSDSEILKSDDYIEFVRPVEDKSSIVDLYIDKGIAYYTNNPYEHSTFFASYNNTISAFNSIQVNHSLNYLKDILLAYEHDYQHLFDKEAKFSSKQVVNGLTNMMYGLEMIIFRLIELFFNNVFYFQNEKVSEYNNGKNTDTRAMFNHMIQDLHKVTSDVPKDLLDQSLQNSYEIDIFKCYQPDTVKKFNTYFNKYKYQDPMYWEGKLISNGSIDYCVNAGLFFDEHALSEIRHMFQMVIELSNKLCDYAYESTNLDDSDLKKYIYYNLSDKTMTLGYYRDTITDFCNNVHSEIENINKMYESEDKYNAFMTIYNKYVKYLFQISNNVVNDYNFKTSYDRYGNITYIRNLTDRTSMDVFTNHLLSIHHVHSTFHDYLNEYDFKELNVHVNRNNTILQEPKLALTIKDEKIGEINDKTIDSLLTCLDNIKSDCESDIENLFQDGNNNDLMNHINKLSEHVILHPNYDKNSMILTDRHDIVEKLLSHILIYINSNVFNYDNSPRSYIGNNFTRIFPVLSCIKNLMDKNKVSRSAMNYLFLNQSHYNIDKLGNQDYILFDFNNSVGLNNNEYNYKLLGELMEYRKEDDQSNIINVNDYIKDFYAYIYAKNIFNANDILTLLEIYLPTGKLFYDDGTPLENPSMFNITDNDFIRYAYEAAGANNDEINAGLSKLKSYTKSLFNLLKLDRDIEIQPIANNKLHGYGLDNKDVFDELVFMNSPLTDVSLNSKLFHDYAFINYPKLYNNENYNESLYLNHFISKGIMDLKMYFTLNGHFYVFGTKNLKNMKKRLLIELLNNKFYCNTTYQVTGTDGTGVTDHYEYSGMNISIEFMQEKLQRVFSFNFMAYGFSFNLWTNRAIPAIWYDKDHHKNELLNFPSSLTANPLLCDENLCYEVDNNTISTCSSINKIYSALKAKESIDWSDVIEDYHSYKHMNVFKSYCKAYGLEENSYDPFGDKNCLLNFIKILYIYHMQVYLLNKSNNSNYAQAEPLKSLSNEI